jgi:branched-chain amino acid transport system permease protein
MVAGQLSSAVRAGAPAKLVTPEMLKQAVGAGVVTFLLTSLIVGVQTVSSTGQLDFTTRFKEVTIVSIAVAIGSLVISQMRAGRPIVGVVVGGGVTAVLLLLLLVAGQDIEEQWLLPFKSMIVNWGSLIIPAAICLRAVQLVQYEKARAAGRTEFGERAAEIVQRLLPWVGGVLIVVAIALPWLPIGERAMQKKVIDICTIVLTYIMLGWGLNIVVGLAGLLDLGYVAFYAVGAYTYAMLSVYFGWSFWICLPLAGLLAATFGVLLGFPVLRLRGDYLAIVTLGFGEMIRIVLVNWRTLTNGPNGITKIPRASFFGLPMERNPPDGVVSFHQFFKME